LGLKEVAAPLPLETVSQVATNQPSWLIPV